jgi:hypothetical protein
MAKTAAQKLTGAADRQTFPRRLGAQTTVALRFSRKNDLGNLFIPHSALNDPASPDDL